MINILCSIHNKAYELGLSLIGITDPSLPAHYVHFENWLAQKYFGDMKYLENQQSREIRKKPILLMTECKSIIVVGLQHLPGILLKNIYFGKIAFFALQPDYHIVIRRKLNLLLKYINEISEIEVKGSIFCDSAPLLEKELAQRAGLGWIGKNSLLISSQFGSFMNLGELFLNIELPNSLPNNQDLCANCHLCFDACPTQCIKEDRTIKADHCISYLTIEHKGIIDQTLRSKMNSWVFGCDICQIICPWNKEKINESQKKVNGHVSLQKRLRDEGFTDEQFFLTFGKSPINRIKRVGFLRNYAIALGNSGSNDAIPDLEFLFNAEDPVIRIYTAWALGKINNPRSIYILDNQLLREKNPDVLKEIRFSITTLN
jgi:epoxyqueuosine reductase